MTNLEIAKLLRKMAAAYKVLKENRFKVVAYENAATSVEHATSELKDLWDDGKLDSIPGLGPSITSHLDEIFKTGHSKHIDQTLNKVKPEVLEKIDKKFAKERRMTLPEADGIAEEIIAYLSEKVEKLGSLRRQVATIGDIDLAVATNEPEKNLEKFVNFPQKTAIIEKGPKGASILLGGGRQVDLRVAKPEEYGAMLQYFTGSKYHNIKLRELALKKHLTLNEYGINKKTFRTEKELYNFLGLDYIPPELREDNGEIQAASEHKLPKLVELKDIKGDLQTHSNFDLETSHDSGANSIEEMQTEAKKLGYEYIAMTNHNPSSKTDILGKIKAQSIYIEKLNSSTKSVRILNLLEMDIKPDGNVPVPSESLNFLDGCLVSIHSSFNLDKDKMTERVLQGLSNPVARIFAHPTGRLLNKREGYELNWDKIFAFCLEHNKALEINAYPERLDLPDILVREAVKKNVLLSLGTDSHQKEDLVNMKYGVAVARRGWAEEKNIINTWNYDKILNWMRERR